MQKWEYLQLIWHYEQGERRHAVNGQFKHDWNGRALHTTLNELGKEGWELVGISEHEAVFKRPVSG